MTAAATVHVLQPGVFTTVQDLGRPGLAHLGVGHAGACDQAALRLANRIVGNQESAAGLELTLGGLVARFPTAATIALTGAPAPLTVHGRPRSFFGPIYVRSGQELHVGLSRQGMRSYLAVRGGLSLPPTLGSRSTDTLSGLGPAVVRRDDVLPVGQELAGPVTTLETVPTVPLEARPVLEVVPGPRLDWFAPGSLTALTTAAWEVTPDSNRIGVRLAGPSLERLARGELPSEGLLEGALQVPPSGRPIMFLADHPTTGGYPVIAVLTRPAVAKAAQLQPGQHMSFMLQRTPA